MSDIEGFGRRTKGLSEVAFQGAYGSEEQCRAALEPRVVLPVLWPWRLLPAEKARQAAVQSLQASGIGDRRHDLSQRQVGAQGEICGNVGEGI